MQETGLRDPFTFAPLAWQLRAVKEAEKYDLSCGAFVSAPTSVYSTRGSGGNQKSLSDGLVSLWY